MQDWSPTSEAAKGRGRTGDKATLFLLPLRFTAPCRLGGKHQAVVARFRHWVAAYAIVGLICPL